MRKYLMLFIMIASIMLCGVVVTSCFDDGGDTSVESVSRSEVSDSTSESDTGIYIEPEIKVTGLDEMYVGQKQTLVVKLTGLSGTVKYESSDKNVLTVDDKGEVTAVGKGNAVVGVSVGDKTENFNITVVDPELLLSLNKTRLNLVFGQGFTIVPTATVGGEKVDAQFSFVSSDESVATVSDAGLVTAAKAGKATITVTATYGTVEKTAEVSVNVGEDVTLDVGDTEIVLSQSPIEGYDYSTTHQLSPVVTVNGTKVADPQIEYSVDSSEVATVSVGGLITVVGGGETNITVSFRSNSGSEYTQQILVRCYPSEMVKTTTDSSYFFNFEDTIALLGYESTKLNGLNRLVIDGYNKEYRIEGNNLLIKKVEEGLHLATMYFANDEKKTVTLFVSGTDVSVTNGERQVGTLAWMGDGNCYVSGSTFFGSGKYRSTDTTWSNPGEVQYSLVPFVADKNVLSIDLAHDGSVFDTFNSLLRIQLGYNGKVYSYDAGYNVWKDEDGTVNDNILMYTDDGSVAYLNELPMNVAKYVRMTIVGIGTDLKIISNPPEQQFNNGIEGTYVAIAHKNVVWRTLDSTSASNLKHTSYAVVFESVDDAVVNETGEISAVAKLYVTGEKQNDAKISYKSSDETVFTVDENGTITGVSVGTAYITAYAEVSGKTYSCKKTITVIRKDVLKANANYDAYLFERSSLMPISGLDSLDLSTITGVAADKKSISFEIRDGILYITKLSAGVHDLTLTTDSGDKYYSLDVKDTSSEAALSNGTLEWGGGSAYNPMGTYYYSSGKYRTDNGKEQYAEIPYVDGMNALSFEIAGDDPVGIGYTDNHLLRIQLRFNGKTYSYDKLLNVWKDENGVVNDKILMMLVSNGEVVNLTKIEKTDFVRFVVLGITTSLQIVNDPPATAHNNQDDSTFVNISYRKLMWYSLDNADIVDVKFVTFAVILPGNTEVSLGSSVDLAAEVYKTGVKLDAPEILYTFDDGTIAKYENGKVYGLKAGVTAITATYEAADGKSYSVTANISVIYAVVTANYYYDVVDNTVGTDMPIYGLPETITLSEITGVTIDGTSVEFSVKNGALHIPKVLGGYHEIVLTDNGGNANTFTLKVTQSSADGEWKAGTLQWGYGASDTYYGVAGGALSSGKYRSDGATEQYSYYAYAEGMNAVTFKIADYNWGDYNSLMRIQLGFNGKVYTYDGETNAWKDADGNVNANIRMFKADGSKVTNLADIAKSVNGDIGELVTFVITDITTDLKIINNPPTTNHDPGDSNTYVTLTNNGCTWYNL